MDDIARQIITSSSRSNVDPFLAMDVVAKAAKLSSEGNDIISMAVGQPGASAPECARQAAVDAINTGKIGYTSAPGITKLQHRIARHYKDTYCVDVDPNRIYATTGSSAGFVLSFLSLFEEGARIAIPSPGYPAYRNIIKALSMIPVEIRTDADSRWTLNAELLEQAHAEQPLGGLLFANPNNPNGSMLERGGFQKLIEAANQLGIKFISDEIYHGLTYEMDGSCALEFTDDVIIINSFSKFFCMTGWRIGWMIVPDNLVRTIDRLQQNLYICAPEISQIAAVAAFDGIAEMQKVREGYVKNRELFLQRLPKIGLTNIQPIDGAFYAYADITPLSNNSMDLASEILDKTGVAVTPGLDFDIERGKSWMRFSFAGENKRMIEAFDRLDHWFQSR